MTTIFDIFTFIKNNSFELDMESMFEELERKYNFFDVELGYYSYLNYLDKNNIQSNDKKMEFKEIRKDYNYKQNVKNIYNEKCIITGTDMDECSICHIKPLCESLDDEKYDFNNGIILSESLHRLFDKYLFTIHPDTFEIIISEKTKNKKSLINDFCNKKLDINFNSKKYLDDHYNKFISKNI